MNIKTCECNPPPAGEDDIDRKNKNNQHLTYPHRRGDVHLLPTPLTMSDNRSKTILITGGSGFVAGHVLRSFLTRGYNVRTTVRSQASADKIKRDQGKWADQLSFTFVSNIELEGAFDEAVTGVDGVRKPSVAISLTIMSIC